jgi:hypothetical protein
MRRREDKIQQDWLDRNGDSFCRLQKGQPIGITSDYLSSLQLEGYQKKKGANSIASKSNRVHYPDKAIRDNQKVKKAGNACATSAKLQIPCFDS